MTPPKYITSSVNLAAKIFSPLLNNFLNLNVVHHLRHIANWVQDWATCTERNQLPYIKYSSLLTKTSNVRKKKEYTIICRSAQLQMLDENKGLQLSFVDKLPDLDTLSLHPWSTHVDYDRGANLATIRKTEHTLISLLIYKIHRERSSKQIPCNRLQSWLQDNHKFFHNITLMKVNTNPRCMLHITTYVWK